MSLSVRIKKRRPDRVPQIDKCEESSRFRMFVEMLFLPSHPHTPIQPCEHTPTHGHAQPLDPSHTRGRDTATCDTRNPCFSNVIQQINRVRDGILRNLPAHPEMLKGSHNHILQPEPSTAFVRFGVRGSKIPSDSCC